MNIPNSSSKTTKDEASAPARPGPQRIVTEPSLLLRLSRIFFLIIIVAAVL